MHVRTGLETPYLSDEFMEYIKLCSEKAIEEEMLCWLYDEDRYPSGAAGGLVTKNLRYRARHLLLSKRTILILNLTKSSLIGASRREKSR